jgi:hypothetical protein
MFDAHAYALGIMVDLGTNKFEIYQSSRSSDVRKMICLIRIQFNTFGILSKIIPLLATMMKWKAMCKRYGRRYIRPLFVWRNILSMKQRCALVLEPEMIIRSTSSVL